jgi:predicted 3-demethylubiquinone-9 3-methyltransferase (glyoxalase superfamily)
LFSARKRPQRTPEGTPPALPSPAAALDGHFEHPAGLTLAEINTRLSTQFEGVKVMQKISPCLWFDNHAEEAVNFYVSIFKNSKVGRIARYGEAGAEVSGRPNGSVMTVEFKLEGQEFLALNGGPHFKFTEAVSFVVNCETQEKIDEMWEKLSKGGEKGQCGWLKDKYGLSWQIVPPVLSEMLQDKDTKKSERVMKAMLHMKKLDIKTLKQAYEQQ